MLREGTYKGNEYAILGHAAEGNSQRPIGASYRCLPVEKAGADCCG